MIFSCEEAGFISAVRLEDRSVQPKTSELGTDPRNVRTTVLLQSNM